MTDAPTAAALAQLLALAPRVFPAVAIEPQWAAALKEATAALKSAQVKDEAASTPGPRAQPSAAAATGLRAGIGSGLLPDHRQLAGLRGSRHA